MPVSGLREGAVAPGRHRSRRDQRHRRCGLLRGTGEVACIWTEDKDNPFYQAAQDAYRTLSQATDAKGRRLKVHKLCLTREPCRLEGAETIDAWRVPSPVKTAR